MDGINVRDMKLTPLRQNIGLATQDVLLYSDILSADLVVEIL